MYHMPVPPSFQISLRFQVKIFSKLVFKIQILALARGYIYCIKITMGGLNLDPIFFYCFFGCSPVFSPTNCFPFPPL